MEEKKAIEVISELTQPYIYTPDIIEEAIRVVLQSLKNKDKEIKELKEENRKFMNAEIFSSKQVVFEEEQREKNFIHKSILDTLELLTLDEVAKKLKVSNQTIYNMIKDKRIKAIKVGREWRFNNSLELKGDD